MHARDMERAVLRQTAEVRAALLAGHTLARLVRAAAEAASTLLQASSEIGVPASAAEQVVKLAQGAQT